MARIDASTWVPEEHGSKVLRKVMQTSAIEQFGNRVAMASDTKEVPRSGRVSVDVVGLAGAYGEAATDLDTVVLKTRKFGKIFRVAEEELNDSVGNLLEEFRLQWARSYGITYDNAALGVTAIENGTTVPYTSLYYAVSQAADVADRRIQSAGAVTYDHLNGVLSVVEQGDYFDEGETVIIAHPSYREVLRGLKDSTGNPIFVQGQNDNPDRVFGFQAQWSLGARTSATNTDQPTGNPLMIVGNRQFLLNGVRSGPESQVSTDAEFRTDEPLLKVRARRGFAVGQTEAFAILEKTAGV